MNEITLNMRPMQELLALMKTLREQCPWDRQQTPESLTQYAIEEAYEVEDAIRNGNVAEIKEELGDLLLQVIFQSQMYAEQGAFDFQDVVETLREKLVRRHPHVFQADFSTLNETDVQLLWQEIKKKEKQQRGQQHSSVLDKVKPGASIIQAQQLQAFAADLKFDWDNVAGAWEKLAEEIAELKYACLHQSDVEIQDELGDCLFAMVNIGRKLNQNCDQALYSTITKFRSRFMYIEQRLVEQGRTFEQSDLHQLDTLWNEAKGHEKQAKMVQHRMD